MNNTWFYSLSTIAQVMAAMAGLFPIFVIFSMDKLKKNIDKFREMIINSCGRDGHSTFKMSDGKLLKMGREYLKSHDGQITFSTYSGEL